MIKRIVCIALTVGFVGAPALGQFISGSDGSDGAFSPIVNIEIDLALASDATWDTPSPVGLFDLLLQVFQQRHFAVHDVPVVCRECNLLEPSGADLGKQLRCWTFRSNGRIPIQQDMNAILRNGLQPHQEHSVTQHVLPGVSQLSDFTPQSYPY